MSSVPPLNARPKTPMRFPLRVHKAERTLLRNLRGFFEEAQGEETRPTYYHRWNRKEPFHIDYCFMPAAWMQQVRNVEVGGYEDWKAASDHRPLVIDIHFDSETAVDLEAGGVRIAR